jgi:hypothetical protein
MSALHDAVEEYLSIRRALGSPIRVLPASVHDG